MGSSLRSDMRAWVIRSCERVSASSLGQFSENLTAKSGPKSLPKGIPAASVPASEREESLTFQQVRKGDQVFEMPIFVFCFHSPLVSH